MQHTHTHTLMRVLLLLCRGSVSTGEWREGYGTVHITRQRVMAPQINKSDDFTAMSEFSMTWVWIQRPPVDYGALGFLVLRHT